VEDVRNINDRTGRIDICQQQRDRFQEAKVQIAKIQLNTKNTGPRATIHQEIPFDVAQQASSQNVLVSAVPDGRIMRLCSSQVQFTTRVQCQTVTCKKCMTNPRNPAQSYPSVPANIISVLYHEQMTDKGIQEQLLNFLAHYRTAQRSIWSGNDFFFNREWHIIIERVIRAADLRAFLPSVLFMVITLVEAAVGEDLTSFDFQVEPLRDIAPEELKNILQEVDAQFRQAREFSRGEERQANDRFDPGNIPGLSDDITTREFPVGGDETPFSEEGFEERWKAAHAAAHEQVEIEPSNAERKWYADEPGIVKVKDFIERETAAKLLMGSPMLNDYVYGAARREDDLTIIIRLVSLTRNYVALKTYVEGLIASLRFPNAPPPDWEMEYLKEENQKPFVVGESWDEYPYPNPNSSRLPGITAWLSVDGRAQIIVRKG
jgi:hypothetical protein